MKRTLLSALFCVPFFVATTDAAPKTFVNPPGQTIDYVNNGSISTPVIDALNFINNGTFIANTVLPFETSSTLNFTNTGTMRGSPGWWFNNSPASVGQRQAAASFFNGNLGQVNADNIFIIWANNIVNRGALGVGAAGNIDMFGKGVNLSRSIVSASSVPNTPFPFGVTNGPNQFVPDLALYDQYWALSNFTANIGLDTATIWDGNMATAPGIPAAGAPGFPGGIAGFSISLSTNVFGTQTAGFAEANTNNLTPIPGSGILIVDYDFLSIPDTMDIFLGTDLTVPIFSSGVTNGAGTFRIPYGPTTATNIIIIMNLGGNPDIGTSWSYTPRIFSLAAGGSSLPGAWYSNIVSRTTVNITNFPGGVTGPTNVIPISGVYSNITKGAVFASVPPQFKFDISFTPGRSNFNTAGVLLSLAVTNSSTSATETNYLFFEDTLPSQPGERLLLNALSGTTVVAGNTFRPTNYLVWDRQFHALGPIPGTNGTPEANFFVDSGDIFELPNDIGSDVVSNSVINSGLYSAYEILVDSVAVRPPLVAGGTITNLPGSLRIHADDLDISNARLRGEGEIFLQANNLISSTNALLDCENLRFDIGSTSGNLIVQNLASDRVEGRIRGTVRAWSATWSNAVQLVFPNNEAIVADPNDPSNTNGIVVQAPLTNLVTVSYHVFILDASGLQTSFPVNVFTLIMHGTNITLVDNATVYESFAIDGLNFTLNGRLTFPGFLPTFSGFPIEGTALQNWINTNAPNVLFFTNNGIISVPSEAHFGDDRPPYTTFINRGSISAGSIQIGSGYTENDGTLNSSGILAVNGQTIKFLGGTSTALNFIDLTATDLVISNHVLFAAGALNLTVSGNLSDAGSVNSFQVQDGINLLVKPATGDLLGTAIRDVAPRPTGQLVTHLWAGEDRGQSNAGFLNNTAIGTLALVGNSGSLFSFAGVGTQNGLYVDVLDLSGLNAGFTNEIEISANLVIYFASVILPAGITLPSGTLPEEFLDGKLGGHLRWVPSFAGPASSVSLDINGKNFNFNRALRNSMTVDSDGDGIVNGLDATPFRAPYTGPSAASFSGLFYGTNGVQYLQSGAVSITTTKKGKYSGALRTGAKKYSFSGKFDSNGADTRNVPKSALSLHLQAGQDQISGTVANGTNWISDLDAERMVFGKSSKAPFAGAYGMTFPGSGDTNNSLVPLASGKGAVKVNPAGKVTFNGALGDGTKMSQTASVSQDGLWPLFVPLYKGKGQILSWQTFSGNSNDVSGPFSWIKQANAAAKSYPAGFKVETNSAGSKLP